MPKRVPAEQTAAAKAEFARFLKSHGVEPVQYSMLEYDGATGELIQYQKSPDSPVMVKKGGEWVEYEPPRVEPRNPGKGGRKKRRILTDEQVVDLLVDWYSDNYSKSELAELYDVSVATVTKKIKDHEEESRDILGFEEQ